MLAERTRLTSPAIVTVRLRLLLNQPALHRRIRLRAHQFGNEIGGKNDHRCRII